MNGGKMSASGQEKLAKLLQTVQTGSESERSLAFETIHRQFRPLLLRTVERYRGQLPSLANEDLLQEATITLYRAALHFHTGQQQVTFGLYAGVCLHNRFVTLLRTENARPKIVSGDVERYAGHAPAPEKLPYRPRTREERGFVRMARLLGIPPVPAAVAKFRRRLLRKLSPLEKEVFRRFFAGDHYEEIASALGKDLKSVDNTLTRIRRKAKELRASLPPDFFA